jgi:hypothetical protein
VTEITCSNCGATPRARADLDDDRLIGREAATGAAIAKAPQQHLQQCPGDRPLVLAGLLVSDTPGLRVGRYAGLSLALRFSGTVRPAPNTFSRRALIIGTAGGESEFGRGRATPGKPAGARPRAAHRCGGDTTGQLPRSAMCRLVGRVRLLVDRFDPVDPPVRPWGDGHRR